LAVLAALAGNQAALNPFFRRWRRFDAFQRIGIALAWSLFDAEIALLESQNGAPGKASLYADVKVTYLPNDRASKTAIEDAFDDMARSMATNEPGQDMAVILVSSHGEMIDKQFYLVPYGFVANGSQNAATDSAVSASEFV
jgi:hypothetical protein